MNSKKEEDFSEQINPERQLVSEMLQKIIAKIHNNNFALIGCVLLGSRARGDFCPDSDTDVVLIFNRMWSIEGLYVLFQNEMKKVGLVPDDHNFRPEGIRLDEIHRARDDTAFREHFIRTALEGFGPSAVPISVYQEVEELLGEWLKNTTDWKTTHQHNPT